MDLPESLTPLFHNYEVATISPSRHASLIILTVLSRGDWFQVEALFALYGWEQIEEVVRADVVGLRTLPDVVANLWSVIFWGRPLNRKRAVERWAPTRSVGRRNITDDPVGSG